MGVRRVYNVEVHWGLQSGGLQISCHQIGICQSTHSHGVYILGVYQGRSKVWGSADLMLPNLGLLENSFKWGSTPWGSSGGLQPRGLQFSGQRIWIWLGVYSLELYRSHATTFDSWSLAEYSLKWRATVWESKAGVYSLGVCRSHSTKLGEIYRTLNCTSCLGESLIRLSN